MLLLVTVVNGQPFFYPDTSNYVRAPDAAVVWLFGERFATSWTSADVIKMFGRRSADRVPSKSPPTSDSAGSTSERSTSQNAQDPHTNSLDRNIIIYGRSAYYGALLYLGTVTGGFWFSVFTQALVVSYLIFILAVRCFRLPTSAFVLTIVILSFFSTVPFFVGFLMPYIFAAVTIMVTGIFIVYWDHIRPPERIVLAIILAFSLLSHETHVLICVLMLFAYGIATLSYRFRVRYSHIASIVTLFACILVGIFGQIAFGTVVKKITGISPIRPPLITARFINLGPGYQYLKANCSDPSFAVCQFLARLPVGTDSFIWSPDPQVGIFTPAASDVKRALADEQFSFAMNVFRFDPFGLVLAMLTVGGHQMITFGLIEFKGAENWKSFSDVPALFVSKMRETIASKHAWIVDMISVLDYVVVVLSCLILITAGVIFAKQGTRYFLSPRVSDNWPSKFLFCAVIGIGVVANAFICASFSTVHNHYQARVIWLIPLLAVLVVVSFLDASRRRPVT